MADIQVHCGECGQDFSVPPDMGGLLANCPACSAQNPVPLPERPVGVKAQLHIRKGQEVGAPTKRCPHCQATCPADAILCTMCGFNWRTGMVVTESRWSSQALLGLWISLVVLLVLGLGAGVWHFLLREPGPAVELPPPVMVTPPASTQTLRQAAAPVEAVPPVETAVVAQAQSPTNAVAAAQAEEAEQLRKLESARAIYRDHLTRELPSRLPLLSVGETVTVRRASGMVVRGTYRAYSAAGMFIQTDAGMQSVPVAELDNNMRLRCDEDLRKQWLEYQVKKQHPDLPAR